MSTIATTQVHRPMRGMNPLYPCSDGKPIADNTLQFQWIVMLHGNIDSMFRTDPQVFVAADNLIYPVEGHVEICQAPDVYVVFGRPKEHRGSYIVFEEEGIFPQVIFEVRSPSNRTRDMARTLLFYDQFGAEEYYDYDPQRDRLRGYRRVKRILEDIPEMNGFVSPRLGIRFDTSGDELVIYRPDGERFMTYQEVQDARAEAVDRAVTEQKRADAERQRADAERQRAAEVEGELDRMKALLRAAGIDPDKPTP